MSVILNAWRSLIPVGLILTVLAAGCAKKVAPPEEVACVVPIITVTSALSFTQRNRTITQGTLICSTTGQPIVGAIVDVTYPDGVTRPSGWTNAQGVWSEAYPGTTFAAGAIVTARFANTGAVATGTIQVRP